MKDAALAAVEMRDQENQVEEAAYTLLQLIKVLLTLDLQTEAGLQQAHHLILQADSIVENFCPTVRQRLGVGCEQLCHDGPGLNAVKKNPLDARTLLSPSVVDPARFALENLKAYETLDEVTCDGGPHLAYLKL